MVGASIGGLKSGLGSAAKTVKGFASRVGGIGSAVTSAMAPIAGAIGAGGLVLGLTKASQSIDKVAKSADSMGVGTEELIGLHHAADLAGVSNEALDTGVGKMLRTIGDASTGSKTAANSLGALGLSASELSGLGADEQFGLIADRIGAISDPAKRASAAMDIFGRGAMTMMPLLMSGSGSIKAAADETVRLGMSFSRLDAAKVEASNDAFTTLKSAVGGVFQQLAIQLAPTLEHVFTNAATWIADCGKAIVDFTATGIREILFFASTWSLQWELIKNNAAMIWQNIKADAVGSYMAMGAAILTFGENVAIVFSNMATNAKAFAVGTVDAVKAAFSGENPIEAFKAGYMKELTSGGIKEMKPFGAAMKEAYDQGFSSVVDPKLAAERERILRDIESARTEFEAAANATPAGTAKSSLFEEAPTPEGYMPGGTTEASYFPDSVASSKLAASAQVGTSEAASQIFAAMSARRGQDDKVAVNTERTAIATEQMVTAIKDLEVPDIDVVESF